MSGYLLVVDGTRALTLDRALALRDRIVAEVGEVPFVLCLNKADLKRSWDLDEAAIEEIEDEGHPVLETSAKTGAGVEAAFAKLATLALNPRAAD
jgi:Fe2+ transport system protein B